MGFIELTEQLLNKMLTENGDLAYRSTGSSCLDYFALIGGMRGDLKHAAVLFVRAFHEDSETAAKLLFYTRDPRGGIGERRLFRFLFSSLSLSYPEKAKALIRFIPKYGRYDDLLCLLDTPLEGECLELIEAQLNEDLAALKEGKSVSLLGKWLPSINTSNDDARAMARKLAKALGYSYPEYRKILSSLRKGRIVENNLRELDYSFDYAKVPSLAMQKYAKAFHRYDEERYGAYLKSVASGETKMNVAVADVVTLVKRCKQERLSPDFNPGYFDTAWGELLKEGAISKRTIVVRDGSGSMTMGRGDAGHTPLEVADAMALLASSRLKGEFADKFITFSSEPELVDLSSCKSLLEKILLLEDYDDCSNTNIAKVYDLILSIYAHPSFKEEDALDQILIVSDMEFDPLCDNAEVSTFEYFDKKFKELGYPRPEVVFWNVDARHIHSPVTDSEEGVKLISGSSKRIIDMVTSFDSINPLDFMKKALEPYEEIGLALKEVSGDD